MGQWYWHILTNAYPAVDTFFFIGGFLALHLLVRLSKPKTVAKSQKTLEEEKAVMKTMALGNMEMAYLNGSITFVPGHAAGQGYHEIDLDSVVDSVPSSPAPIAAATSVNSSTAAMMEPSKSNATAAKPLSCWRRAVNFIFKCIMIYVNRWLRLTPAFGGFGVRLWR